MNYKSHLVGGVLIGLVGVKLLNNFGVDLEAINKAILISASTLGALLPDIDHKGSYIGRRAKITSTIASTIFKHRGVTHSPVIISASMFSLYFAFNKFLMSGAIVDISFLGTYIGIMSHILLDSFTIGGVPLLYPLNKKKFSFGLVKTGGNFETVVLLIMILLILMTIR